MPGVPGLIDNDAGMLPGINSGIGVVGTAGTICTVVLAIGTWFAGVVVGITGSVADSWRRAVIALSNPPRPIPIPGRLGGNTTEAAPYLEHALRLRPGSPEVRLQVGALYVSTARLSEARKILEKLEKDWPDFVQVHLQLATLYSRLGLKEKSQTEREIVLRLNQKDRETGPTPDRK